MKKKVENMTPEIEPEEYFRILKGLKLLSISLVNCSARANSRILGTDSDSTDLIDTKMDQSARFEKEDNRVFVYHEYTVRGRFKRKVLLDLKAEFSVEFESAEEFTEAFFEAFREVSLSLATWPYLRELVASLTGRMDLPKLNLGLYTVPFGRPQKDEESQ